jgi:putative transcriptional regulator
MAKKVQIFDELMEGFRDAIARKKGHAVSLRVTEIPRVKPMRPRQIKKIRKALGASQAIFAYILNVSPKVVQSWEHGARRPTNAALKLLSIAQSDPHILLQSGSTSGHRAARREPRPSRASRTRLSKNERAGR